MTAQSPGLSNASATCASSRLQPMKGTVAVTGDPAAEKLLSTDPLALLTGMLLDQRTR